MIRRTFIKSLAGFVAAVGLGLDKLQVTPSWPFVRRRQVPQIVSSSIAQGGHAISFYVPYAKTDDVLIAMIASYEPNGVSMEWDEQPEWNLMSRQQQGNVVQRFWYTKAEETLRDQQYVFANNGADKMVGQVSVIRGVDTPVLGTELPMGATVYPTQN